MRRTWLTLFLWMPMWATAPVYAQTPIRVLTDADVPTNPAEVGGHDTVRVTPLYGGSDRSAYQIDDEQRLAPAPPTPFVLAEFPAPAGLLPGDVLVGHALATNSNNASDYPPPQIEVALAGPDGRWVTVGHADVPYALDGENATASSRREVRVSVPFDPAHPPSRVRVTALLPNLGASIVHLTMTVAGLRVAYDTPPAVVTPPAAVPSPTWPPAGLAETVVRRFSGNDFDPHLRWGEELVDRTAPVTVSGTGNAGDPVIVNVHTPSPDGLRSIPLMAVDDPGVTAGRYAVTGMISYGGAYGTADVDGFGYLELASDFPVGPPTVVRATATSGLLRLIRGRSGDRPFALPFDSGDRRPTRVRVNLVMSGTGTVTLSALQLVQYNPTTRPAVAGSAAAGPAAMSRLDQLLADEDRLAIKLAFLRQNVPGDPALPVIQAELDAVRQRVREVEPAAPPSPWWARARVTVTAAGLFGLVGFLGLAEPLIRRGRGRTAVLAAVVGVGLLGQVYFGWAMAVAGHGEPARAWGPLGLAAVAGWCVPACIPVLNRRYCQAELRRMRALDAVA